MEPRQSTGQPRSTEQDTTLGGLVHLIALLFGFLGPLLVYLIADDAFTKDNAGNALNWQLFLFVAVFGLLFAAIVFVFVLPELVLVLFAVGAVLVLADVGFCVLAAVKAFNGETWSYPLAPNLL